MPKNTTPIPLYSRASDRSIAECSFRWHSERGGAEISGASWFDIGTAMHTVYERGIERKWKSLPTYEKHAVEEVLNLVQLGLDVTGGGDNYLVSRHRPIDTESLTQLATDLAISFYEDVVVNPPEWLPDIYGDGWHLEEVVTIPSTHPDWEWEAGASTTIDALYMEDGKFLLVDWKTGRSRKSDPRQLQFYRYLLELQGYEAAHNVWGAFFHAEHGTWQIVDEYDPEGVERLIATSQALKKARPQATPTWLCDYCPAKQVCPAWAEDAFDAEVLQQMADERRRNYSYLLDPPSVK